MAKKLLITHHAPDMDACASVWLFKRFDSQEFADSPVDFVNPGDTVDPAHAEHLGFFPHQVVHVDTGLGEFDHHQPERGHTRTCASLLVYEHLCELHPELLQNSALAALVELITQVDLFEDIHWPEAKTDRIALSLPELITGRDQLYGGDDGALLQYGMDLLDCALAVLTARHKAQQEITQQGTWFQLKYGQALAVSTANQTVLRLAQQQGAILVITKDPQQGNIRVKARPDSSIDLKTLHEAVLKVDHVGTWYYHPSGKMLLNGSNKKQQTPSSLTLKEITKLVQATID